MSIPVLLRVDIDFSFGLKKGVPYILELCETYGIKATFFCVMGPDTVSLHAKRFSKKGYGRRILTMNPLKMLYHFGPLFFLYGRVLPQQFVGMQYPHVLKEIVENGHELGMHGYNHALWADKWASLSRDEVRVELDKANDIFCNIFGKPCRLWGAPNWRTMQALYDELEERGSLYTSNVRGATPFYPQFGERVYKTLELPISLPAIHELKQSGMSGNRVLKILKECLNNNYNQWVVHCYYEGILERKLFRDALAVFVDTGCSFLTFNQFYEKMDTSQLQAEEIETVTVPGGLSFVSCQKRFIHENYFSAVNQHLQ